MVQKVGGPVLASSIPGVDAADLPANRGEVKVGNRTYDAANLLRKPDFLGSQTKVAVLASKVKESTKREEGSPTRRRHPHRLLDPRLHLRPARVALAAAPDRVVPPGRAPPGFG